MVTVENRYSGGNSRVWVSWEGLSQHYETASTRVIPNRNWAESISNALRQAALEGQLWWRVSEGSAQLTFGLATLDFFEPFRADYESLNGLARDLCEACPSQPLEEPTGLGIQEFSDLRIRLFVGTGDDSTDMFFPPNGLARAQTLDFRERVWNALANDPYPLTFEIEGNLARVRCKGVWEAPVDLFTVLTNMDDAFRFIRLLSRCRGTLERRWVLNERPRQAHATSSPVVSIRSRFERDL